MSQTHEEKTVRPALVRAEALVDRIGQNTGMLAALTWQRVQQTATQLSKGNELTAQPETAQGEAQPPEGEQVGENSPPTMQRAGEIADNVGHLLDLYKSVANLQVQKWVAYAREGVEDIWAEAQHIRSSARKSE